MDLLMRCAAEGVPFFCCSLAYATENKLSSVSAGIVQDLSNGDAYWAASGKGAFLNGTPMHVYSGEPLYNILGLNISGADAGLLARLQPLFESYNHLHHFGANALIEPLSQERYRILHMQTRIDFYSWQNLQEILLKKWTLLLKGKYTAE